jgi:hypothetical protein
MMTDDIESIFDEHGAGKFLGGDDSPVSDRTLQRWRSEGSGPAFLKMGQLVRYQQSELEEFRRTHRRTSTSDTGSSKPRGPVS